MSHLQSLLFFANQQIAQAVRNSPALCRGTRGNGVRCIQLALYSLGYQLPRSVRANPLAADGIFGTETDTVLRQFQQRNALTADGYAGPKTIAVLDRLLIARKCDPAGRAVYEFQRIADRIGQSVIKDQAISRETKELSNRLGSVDNLIFGDPIRSMVRVRQLLGIR
jgi:murein L,D-transpeptidase YcbB/YkuD